MEVRRTTEADWGTLKEVRLAALRDAPYAFGSTYESDVQRSDDEWREWATPTNEQVALLAFENDQPIGMAGAFLAEDDSARETAHLIAMWVSPGARRKGVGRALAVSVIDWAAEMGLQLVTLGVANDNPAARKLYADLGFRPTGVTKPLHSDPGRLESGMEIVVNPARR